MLADFFCLVVEEEPLIALHFSRDIWKAVILLRLRVMWPEPL
jgi:hypothetical protein